MPNATLRANVRPMPEATNRRAVLGAVLAAGATAALPAAARADVMLNYPDAELFALIKSANAAKSSGDEACAEADDLLPKMAPPFPVALVWTEAGAQRWRGVRPGQRPPKSDIDFLRIWLKLERKPDPVAVGVPPFIPALDFVERAQEIVSTQDEYAAARRAAEEHPDVFEAVARQGELAEQFAELATRIAATPAKTPEGLIAKLEMIASDLIAKIATCAPGDNDDILASTAIDSKFLAQTQSRKEGLVRL
jgi:hypothetical protein